MRAIIPKLQFEFDEEDPNRSFQKLVAHVNDSNAKLNAGAKSFPINDGVRVVQTFVGGDTIAIPHKLGRQPVGWLVIDADAYWALARAGWDATTITINSFSPGTITFWVF